MNLVEGSDEWVKQLDVQTYIFNCFQLLFGTRLEAEEVQSNGSVAQDV